MASKHKYLAALKGLLLHIEERVKAFDTSLQAATRTVIRVQTPEWQQSFGDPYERASALEHAERNRDQAKHRFDKWEEWRLAVKQAITEVGETNNA